MYCLFCVILCIVCKCVLYYCHRVTTQLQLINISYHITVLRGASPSAPRRDWKEKWNKRDKIWKLWICAAMNCVQVSTGYKLFSSCSVLWSSVHSKYYRPKCSACHASAESALSARFLGSTRNIQNVNTPCFFVHSVNCLANESKVEKNQVAVQCYLFLSAF